MLDFILKIYNLLNIKPDRYFFHPNIVQLYIIMYFYIIQTVFKPFKNHKNQRSQIMLDFILKIYNLLNIKPDRYFFHPNIVQLYIIMYFYIIQTVFKPFKNHKNQRSQIMLDFILKIYNLLKVKPDQYFFHLKIVQLYIIMYFYVIQTVFKPFKNHKNQRSQIVLNFILKIYNLLKSNRINIFSPQNSSVIYNYVFLYYLDCFQTI